MTTDPVSLVLLYNLKSTDDTGSHDTSDIDITANPASHSGILRFFMLLIAMLNCSCIINGDGPDFLHNRGDNCDSRGIQSLRRTGEIVNKPYR